MVTPSSRKLLKAGARISKRWWPHVRRPFAARSIVPAQGIGPGFHRRTGRIQHLASNEQQQLQVRFAQCVVAFADLAGQHREVTDLRRGSQKWPGRPRRAASQLTQHIHKLSQVPISK